MHLKGSKNAFFLIKTCRHAVRNIENETAFIPETI